MTVGTGAIITPTAVIPEEKNTVAKKRDYRSLFRIGILAVRFMQRVKMRLWKKSVDRAQLRVRPFRNKEVYMNAYLP
jgi:hypothetical protein